ncbi:MAG: hypothetical protein L6Q76_30135, partial [Polyangiaceae bacterium]|nr:hypothetical protein [Polyangiaceae bacterium]
AGYSAELTSRLVPRLVARGEQARKAGDIPGAAADYNRAIALAPGDLTILKRLGSLTSSQSRKLLLRRAAIALSVSLVLGISAFGAARYLRDKPLDENTTTTTKSPPESPTNAQPIASTAPTPPITAEPPPKLDPTAQVPSDPTADANRPPKSPPQPWSSGLPGPRKVRFSIIPKGAKLTLDGQDVAWFSTVFSLAPGPHQVRVTVPKSKCCKPYSGTQTILPAPVGKPDEVQAIVIRLETLPATVSLAGAPPNGQYTCPSLGLSGFSGGSKQITLSDVVWVGTCEFRAPSASVKNATVTLKAGEPNTIEWP